MGRAAATLLREGGLRPTVVDARFVKPLDTALLDRLAATHERIVTVEENVVAGGFGSAVLEHFAGSGVRVLPFGLPDSFVAYGEREQLLADIGLSPEAIAGSIVAARPGLARIS
jgi:1-deoxy-D-xylulose-5-phosphate synthase